MLVCDNLNTHSPACLDANFPADEAHRINQKIEWHYTPEHGSWLNMAECELSVLARQCLSRRIRDIETLTQEAQAWETRRNTMAVTIHWQFTTADARIKLRRLYPLIKEQSGQQYLSGQPLKARSFSEISEREISTNVDRTPT